MIVPLANSEETKRPKSKAIVESQIRYATLEWVKKAEVYMAI